MRDIKLAASQRVIYKVGSVVKWLQRTDLQNRRIRLVDLEDKVTGRAAAVIARALQGKDRPDYQPQADGGDVVVAINADKAVLTGKKMEQKKYYRHSGKPGNLKITTPAQLKEQFGGAAIVWNAVNGMLPKSQLRQHRIDRLLIYNDAEHDFDGRALFPLELPEPPARPSKLRWNAPEGFEPVNAAAFYRLWRGADPAWEEKMAALEARRAEAVEGAPEVADAAAARQLMQGLRVQ